MKALNIPKKTSRLVIECREKLKKLVRDNILILCWITAHGGFRKNKRADLLVHEEILMERKQSWTLQPKSQNNQRKSLANLHKSEE